MGLFFRETPSEAERFFFPRRERAEAALFDPREAENGLVRVKRLEDGAQEEVPASGRRLSAVSPCRREGSRGACRLLVEWLATEDAAGCVAIFELD